MLHSSGSQSLPALESQRHCRWLAGCGPLSVRSGELAGNRQAALPCKCSLCHCGTSCSPSLLCLREMQALAEVTEAQLAVDFSADAFPTLPLLAVPVDAAAPSAATAATGATSAAAAVGGGSAAGDSVDVSIEGAGDRWMLAFLRSR